MKNTIIILTISILLFGLALGAVMYLRVQQDKEVEVLQQTQGILLTQLEKAQDSVAEISKKNTELENQNTSLLKQLGSTDEMIRANYCDIYPQSSIYKIDQTLVLCNVPKLQGSYFITLYAAGNTTPHSTSTLITTQAKQREINLDASLDENIEYTLSLRVDDGDGIFESDVDVAYPQYTKVFKLQNGQLIVR